jgi:SAM-dependent methyltransferase
MSENYLASISEAELNRLQTQHQTWKPETDAFLRDSGFASFKKVVEFGCGPGFTAYDIAKEISPSAEVCGVDISELYLNHLNKQIRTEKISNLNAVNANIASQVEFGSDFDGAFCRWFLAWVAKDLDLVLANILSSLRPGGTFACMEYLTLKSTVCSPPNSACDHLVSAWEQFYLQCGGTTEIGSILPSALLKAGFKIKKINCVGGLAPSGHKLFKWWKTLNEDFNHIFLEKNLLSLEQDLELKKYWEINSNNPNAFIYTPVLVQISATKEYDYSI